MRGMNGEVYYPTRLFGVSVCYRRNIFNFKLKIKLVVLLRFRSQLTPQNKTNPKTEREILPLEREQVRTNNG